MRYALVDSNQIVLNVVEWDGFSWWELPAGTELLPDDDDSAVIGQTYSVNTDEGE